MPKSITQRKYSYQVLITLSTTKVLSHAIHMAPEEVTAYLSKICSNGYTEINENSYKKISAVAIVTVEARQI